MATTQITAELVHHEVKQLREEMRERFSGIEAAGRSDALQAQLLGRASRGIAGITEDQIVDALKADPAMAGRVIVEVAQTMMHGRQEIGRSAAEKLGPHPTTAARCLQFLAVALAAASYRG